MTRLITTILLLLNLFMAAPAVVGGDAPAWCASSAQAEHGAGAFNSATSLEETAADESQEHGLSAEHTDWPLPPEHAAHPTTCLRQTWPRQPVFTVHSAHAGPTLPPPRA